MNWFVIYTKPQQELKVLERLQKINIEAYCPVIEEVRQWSDRKKKVIVPLIKSYVFIRVDFENRFKVFDVPGVVRYLFWMGKPAIVYDNEIIALRESLTNSYSALKIETIAVGERLKIKQGPFQNNEGTVVKVNAKHVTIALEQLGIIVSITY
ncbi:UpxY family transcription antiterminator [Flavobacterium cheonanense]|uniref:UpxY family transcription antiterminator n=1 Tax=Flavobacterium cheonanense TaxID=706183 RepID=A0ABP7W3Q0_9FLAO